MRIAIVEDEEKLAKTLSEGLQEEGYETVVFFDGESFLTACLEKSASYNLVILDLGLPGVRGKEVSTRMREHHDMTPILVLTAHDTIADKVEALDSGADDFLGKPFSFDELMARVRALLRRSTMQGSAVLSAYDITADTRTRIVSRGDAEIILTPTEFDLLYLLLQNRTKPLSREEISKALWDVRDPSLSNIVDVHISNIRKKIDSNHATKRISTIRGLGYQIT